MKTSKRKPRIMWQVFHKTSGHALYVRPFLMCSDARKWRREEVNTPHLVGIRKVIVTEAKP
jgi:hypothetical protein